MKEFKVGGKVICVDDRNKFPDSTAVPVKRNSLYTVNAIRSSDCCGIVLLDVGFKSDTGRYKCGTCGNTHPHESGKWWLRASRFLPLDDFREVTFTELKKEMPVSAQ